MLLHDAFGALRAGHFVAADVVDEDVAGVEFVDLLLPADVLDRDLHGRLVNVRAAAPAGDAAEEVEIARGEADAESPRAAAACSRSVLPPPFFKTMTLPPVGVVLGSGSENGTPSHGDDAVFDRLHGVVLRLARVVESADGARS